MPNRIERESALPLDLFGDEAVFELELAEIWHRDWIFATTVDAVSKAGDFVQVTIGRQNVAIVRGHDYQLRAFANVCSHRGAPLVCGSGNASRLSCPYHAWAYDTEGSLVSVPYAQPDEIAHDEYSLTQFEIAQWHGLVFVRLAPNGQGDGADFDDRVQVIEPYVKPLAVGRLLHDEQTSCELWAANWKLAYSNALDSYSHFRVHPETVEPFSPTDAAYYLAGSAKATVTGGESGERADHLVIALPPSFVAIVYPDAMLWQSFRPVSVDATVVTTGVAGQDELTGGTVVNLPGWDATFIDEDRAICEQLQANAATRFKPGPLLAIERALGDFNEYLSWRLTDHTPGRPVYAAEPGARPEPEL